ncbi:MAG TPA: BatD family protein [Candidatus Polarisedimenticolia bacterium]|nr:BatD family protein [Candidatus Polarisedimenticolia bacterium]
MRAASSLLIALLVLAFLVGPSLAQEAEVRAFVEPARVEEGEEVQFRIQLSGSSQQPDEPPVLPQVPGFIVAQGPSLSSYFQWVNGQSSASRTYTWTLVPQGKGVHTIPPVSLTIGGKLYRTAMLRVDVAERGSSAQGAPGQGGAPPSTFSDPRTRRRLAQAPPPQSSLFVEAQVDKTDLYVGEQATLQYKVYTQYEIVQLSLKDQQPTYQGFWVEDIKADEKYAAQPVTRKEGNFIEYTVLKKALFPTRAGTLTIPELTFHFVARRRSGDPFESFFFQPTESLFRTSEALTLRVKDLPKEGRPPEFSGAVGRFTLSAKADRAETRVNDAVGLKVEVEGQGNINTLGNPTIPALPDFKRYDPKVEESMEAKSGTLVGSKIWNYVLIPLAPGPQEIPPIRFAFFDPGTSRYQVLESAAIPLRVAKGELGEQLQHLPARADIPVLGADIRYIKLGGGKLRDQGSSLYRTPSFIAIISAPLLANLGLLFVARRRAQRVGSESEIRRRRARRTARKRLSRARSHLFQEQARLFYQELASALTSYLADKVGTPATGLTYDRIEEILETRSVDPTVRGRFRRCLETCDFARFAPAASAPAEMEKALTEAESLVETLEGSVKVA